MGGAGRCASCRPGPAPGCRHAGTPVLVLAYDLYIRMLRASGELLRDPNLEPTWDYQAQARM
jgi:hypothetical protein